MSDRELFNTVVGVELLLGDAGALIYLVSPGYIDSIGQMNPNPTYGTDANQLLLESVDEFGLDQLVMKPTRGGSTIDLIFLPTLNQ